MGYAFCEMFQAGAIPRDCTTAVDEQKVLAEGGSPGKRKSPEADFSLIASRRKVCLWRHLSVQARANGEELRLCSDAVVLGEIIMQRNVFCLAPDYLSGEASMVVRRCAGGRQHMLYIAALTVTLCWPCVEAGHWKKGNW